MIKKHIAMRRLICLPLLVIMMTALLSGTVFAQGEAAFTQLSDLKGMVFAVQTGTLHDTYLQDAECLDGDFTINYYNTPADMIQAVKVDKADAALLDKPVAALYCRQNPELTYFSSGLEEGEYGFGFSKGSPYLTNFNLALAQLKQDGVLEELEAKWISSNSEKHLLEQAWEPVNGTMTYWVDTTYEPISYIGVEGTPVGYDVDVVLHAAQIMGVRVEIVPCNYDALIPAVLSGKADIVGSGLTITPERAQSIDFSDPYYVSSLMAIVRDPSAKTAHGGLASIASSFEKTFIRENRWKLFATGIGNTLLITVLSALFGTLLGFVVYMLCSAAAPIVTTWVEAIFALLEQMPIIVFLMILYYVVFGRVDVDGIVVSVVAFTMTFSASMYGMLKSGVRAVSFGQTEAALALGYNRNGAFFKIVLPQAACHFLPAYRSELVSLIKGTAVVGYIAVQDLTKMGDIVRSRTYEAFFPLLATAAIYVLLARLLSALVSRAEFKINFKNRKPEQILKGVVRK